MVGKCAFYILTAIFLSFLPYKLSYYLKSESEKRIKGLFKDSSILGGIIALLTIVDIADNITIQLFF